MSYEAGLPWSLLTEDMPGEVLQFLLDECVMCHLYTKGQPVPSWPRQRQLSYPQNGSTFGILLLSVKYLNVTYIKITSYNSTERTPSNAIEHIF